MKMKKFLLLVPALALLAACGSSPKDTFDRRAHEVNKAQERRVDRAVDQAPKWMLELPVSNSATYQNGTAVSPDMSMAVHKAKMVAFSKICMAAGGRVDQQSRMFRSDTETTSTESSEMAVQTMCPGVDITGVEMVETKMFSEGPRFRAYVLMALPSGDANRLARDRDARDAQRRAVQRSGEVFQELNANRQQ
jgi:hypothetical protein